MIEGKPGWTKDVLILNGEDTSIGWRNLREIQAYEADHNVEVNVPAYWDAKVLLKDYLQHGHFDRAWMLIDEWDIRVVGGIVMRLEPKPGDEPDEDGDPSKMLALAVGMNVVCWLEPTGPKGDRGSTSELRVINEFGNDAEMKALGVVGAGLTLCEDLSGSFEEMNTLLQMTAEAYGVESQVPGAEGSRNITLDRRFN